MNILLQRILCKDPLGRRRHKLRTEGLLGDISYKGYFLSTILLLQTANSTSCKRLVLQLQVPAAINLSLNYIYSYSI